jgi:hypothetical protein
MKLLAIFYLGRCCSISCLLMGSVCVCFAHWHALLAELDCMAASQNAVVAPWDSA